MTYNELHPLIIQNRNLILRLQEQLEEYKNTDLNWFGRNIGIKLIQLAIDKTTKHPINLFTSINKDLFYVTDKFNDYLENLKA